MLRIANVSVTFCRFAASSFDAALPVDTVSFVSFFLTPLSGVARRAATGGLLVCALAASGCSGPSGDAGNAQQGHQVSTISAGATQLAGMPASQTTVLQPLGTANAAPKTQRPSEPVQLAVSGVRVGNHEGFDRVVIDLAGSGDPGWFVDYTPTPMQSTTGRALPMSGNAFLSINLDGTVYPGELGIDDEITVEMSGPTGNVVDVVNGGMYEGRSQIVVGLRSEAPYSVEVLEDPKRLVIDIVQS